MSSCILDGGDAGGGMRSDRSVVGERGGEAVGVACPTDTESDGPTGTGTGRGGTDIRSVGRSSAVEVGLPVENASALEGRESGLESLGEGCGGRLRLLVLVVVVLGNGRTTRGGGSGLDGLLGERSADETEKEGRGLDFFTELREEEEEEGFTASVSDAYELANSDGGEDTRRMAAMSLGTPIRGGGGGGGGAVWMGATTAMADGASCVSGACVTRIVSGIVSATGDGATTGEGPAPLIPGDSVGTSGGGGGRAVRGGEGGGTAGSGRGVV